MLNDKGASVLNVDHTHRSAYRLTSQSWPRCWQEQFSNGIHL